MTIQQSMTNKTYACRVTMLEAKVLDYLASLAGPVTATGDPGSGYSVAAKAVGRPETEWHRGVPLPEPAGATVVMRQYRSSAEDLSRLQDIGYDGPQPADLNNGQAIIITTAS